MDITGKIIKVMPEQSGEGRNGRWVRQEFIIETEDQFPKKICFSMWGEDKVAGLKQLALGDRITVHFNAESREFNDRWYTDLRCWKLEKQLTQSVSGGGGYAQSASNPFIPQGASVGNMPESMPSNAASGTDFASSPLEPDDDLPF